MTIFWVRQKRDCPAARRISQARSLIARGRCQGKQRAGNAPAAGEVTSVVSTGIHLHCQGTRAECDHGASLDPCAVIFQTISNHTAISHSTAILTLGKITEPPREPLIVVHLMT